jgi:hypothetical protein
MDTHTAFRIEAGLAGLLTAAAASATTPVSPAPESPSPEITLYVSVPIGMRHGGALRPKVGLGFGQVQAAGNLSNPAAGDPIRHRELLRFDVSPRAADPAPDMRLTLGGRMTYNVNRGVFGWRKAGSISEPTGITFNTAAPRPVAEAVRPETALSAVSGEPKAPDRRPRNIGAALDSEGTRYPLHLFGASASPMHDLYIPAR